MWKVKRSARASQHLPSATGSPCVCFEPESYVLPHDDLCRAGICSHPSSNGPTTERLSAEPRTVTPTRFREKKTLGNYILKQLFSAGMFGREWLGWNSVDSRATSAGDIGERRRRKVRQNPQTSLPACGLSPTFGLRLPAVEPQSLRRSAWCLRCVDFKICFQFYSELGWF